VKAAMVKSLTARSYATRKNTIYYVNCLVSIGIMILYHFLPTVGTLTRTGLDVMGIFVGIIYAFSTVDIIWPALLGIILLGTSELYTMTGALTAAFGNDTWLFILFVLAFATMINDSGVSNIIANWMVSRKFSRGKPWVISWLLMTTSYVIAALVSVTPGVIIPWAILYTMSDTYGYKQHDKYPTLMVIGITFAALMGNSAFPFKAMAVMIQSALYAQTGEVIDFWLFTILAVCLSYAVVMTYLLLCRFLFRPDVTPIKISDYVYSGETKLTGQQKGIVALLVAFCILLFAPGVLPATFPGITFLKSLGQTGTCALLLCIAGFFVNRDSGRPIIDLAQKFKNGTAWPTMMLMAFAMIMISAMTNEATGIQPFLREVFAPVFGSAPNAVLFIFIVCAVQMILTNVFANLVIALLLIPLVCTYAPMVGASTVMMAVSVCVLTNVSLVFPSASPFAALLHGNSEWVTAKEVYKYTSITIVFVLFVATFICATLGTLLF